MKLSKKFKNPMVVGGISLALVGSITACGTTSASAPDSSGNGSATTSGSATAASSKGNFVIALSNSYIGNSWRQQMVSSFTQAATQAKNEGLISGFKVVNADNTASQQISQINDLILQHVSAICIDAASTTALNGVIQKAAQAGIPVFSFDSVVTAPTAYKVNYNYYGIGVNEAQYVVKRLNGKGNVILDRGIAGTSVDNDWYAGWMSVFKKNPGIKVLGSVWGQWTETTSQSSIAQLLPSLPKVDAILGEGGEIYGAEKAIQAAGRPTPILIGGNRGYFINWWYNENKKNGYQTISESSAPSVGAAAFWLALDKLQDKNVPKSVTMPTVTVTTAELAKYHGMNNNNVVSPTYTQSWVSTNLLNQK